MKPSAENNGKYRIVAEINMIPFIDVALVLLIIFMVMTPFLIRSQIKVNLPEAAKIESETQKDDPVRVQVERNGNIALDGRRVSPEELVSTLERALRGLKVRPLLIEADRDVPFQHVVVVLDAGKKVGATRVGVCVKPESTRR